MALLKRKLHHEGSFLLTVSQESLLRLDFCPKFKMAAMGTGVNTMYPWQPSPRLDVDFGQEAGKAHEAAKFPEIEQRRGLICTNAIREPRTTIQATLKES